MLHYGSKHECADKGYAQRVSNCFVVFLKRILIYVETEPTVKVFKENTAHIVAFVYYYCIFVA